MLATQHSIQNSLRWMRRLIVIILIIANFMTVILADAAPAVQDSQPSFLKASDQPGFNLSTNYNPSAGFYDARPSHLATIQVSSVQARIKNIVARLVSRETGANAPQLIIETR